MATIDSHPCELVKTQKKVKTNYSAKLIGFFSLAKNGGFCGDSRFSVEGLGF